MDPVEYLSLECRWFGRKPMPHLIKQIFDDEKQEHRTDVYWVKDLVDEKNKNEKGIKLREGGFEVKTKQRDIEIPEIPGLVQKWRKLRNPIPKDLKMEGYWLKVPKFRQMIRFAVEKDRPIRPVNTYPPRGCNLELTTFGDALQHFWTFGLEAFGAEDYDLQEILLKTYNTILAKNPGLDEILDKLESASYPKWISTILNSEDWQGKPDYQNLNT